MNLIVCPTVNTTAPLSSTVSINAWHVPAQTTPRSQGLSQQILLDPQTAAAAHGKLDMATVLDLLYG